MTTSYFASSVSLNIVASSVAVTVKPFAVASCCDRLDAGRDRVVPEPGGLAEDQRVEGLVPVPGMGAGGRDMPGIASAAIRASTSARINVPCLRSWIIGSSSWVG